MSKSKPDKNPEAFSYETAVLELRQITDRLQRGEDSFEESLGMFRRSSELIVQCREYLDAIQLELQQLESSSN